MAEMVGAHAALPKATDETNRYQVERLIRIVIPRIPRGGTIGILGMSYKPDTAVIESSQSVELAAVLMKSGYSVVIYDPMASAEAGAVLGSEVKVASSIQECVLASEFLIIAMRWSQFEDISVDCLKRPGRKLPVLDCWRQLPMETYGHVVDLIQLGLDQSRWGATYNSPTEPGFGESPVHIEESV